MKKTVKNNVTLACLTAGLLVSAVGVANVTAKAEANYLSEDLQMKVGASLYLDSVSGLKFTYSVSGYDVAKDGERNFGMMIVPYDYLIKADILEETATTEDLENLTTVDFVTVLNQAATDEVIPYAPIVVTDLKPTEGGVVSYSIGELFEENYVREFFGVGFEVTENGYVYASQDDNVRSVFEVSNLALNKLFYGEWTETEEDVAEQANLSNNETTLNTFITKGVEFVYGEDYAPAFTAAATYVGAEVVVPSFEVLNAKNTKKIDLGIHWNYEVAEGETAVEMTEAGNVKGVARAQAKLTASLGKAFSAETTVPVLKDATELGIYNSGKNVDLFGVDSQSFAAKMVADGKAYSTAKFDGGYWNGAASGDGYKNSGYVVIKNPSTEDGKYALNSTGIKLDFYFTGNNMPNIQFFATDLENIDFGKYGGGTTGYVVTNGVARSDSYYELVKTVNPSYDSETGAYDTSKWRTHSNYKYQGMVGSLNFFRFGASKMNGFNRGKYNANYDSYFASSYALDDTYKSSGYNVMKGDSGTWTSGAATYGTKLSMYELMKDETKNWHYEVCIYTASSKPRWSARISEVNADGTETLYHNKAGKLIGNSTVSGVSGYIVVHGALKGSAESCKDAGNAGYYYTNLAYKMPTASKFTA